MPSIRTIIKKLYLTLMAGTLLTSFSVSVYSIFVILHNRYVVWKDVFCIFEIMNSNSRILRKGGKIYFDLDFASSLDDVCNIGLRLDNAMTILNKDGSFQFAPVMADEFYRRLEFYRAWHDKTWDGYLNWYPMTWQGFILLLVPVLLHAFKKWILWLLKPSS